MCTDATKKMIRADVCSTTKTHMKMHSFNYKLPCSKYMLYMDMQIGFFAQNIPRLKYAGKRNENSNEV